MCVRFYRCHIRGRIPPPWGDVGCGGDILSLPTASLAALLDSGEVHSLEYSSSSGSCHDNHCRSGWFRNKRRQRPSNRSDTCTRGSRGRAWDRSEHGRRRSTPHTPALRGRTPHCRPPGPHTAPPRHSRPSCTCNTRSRNSAPSQTQPGHCGTCKHHHDVDMECCVTTLHFILLCMCLKYDTVRFCN
ncbi:hypothetical protein NP493_330g03090 [Ridgeia piscesae]|uniref:Uncharacterized protein n=1 Tax=Ridgeia piscesae TaxID=27915 RepID=A0AAD9L4Z2_RIDPI|nr:hypothetical protein NP493_330g03090 [Ridgeia piscesae]